MVDDNRMQDLEEYSKRTHFYVDEIPPILSVLLEETGWQHCLDLGCGDGALIAAMHNQGYLDGKLLYAVDASESRIDSVRKISPEIRCIVGDACDTQMEDGSIDLLISTQVIEHVSNDDDMVKEMHRLLRSDGTLYLTTIIKKRYGWYFYRCNGKWTLDPTHVREYGHESYWTFFTITDSKFWTIRKRWNRGRYWTRSSEGYMLPEMCTKTYY